MDVPAKSPREPFEAQGSPGQYFVMRGTLRVQRGRRLCGTRPIRRLPLQTWQPLILLHPRSKPSARDRIPARSIFMAHSPINSGAMVRGPFHT